MNKEDQILSAIEKLTEQQESFAHKQTQFEANQTKLFNAIENLTENQNRMESAIEKLTENQNRMESAIEKLTDGYERLVENQIQFAEGQKQMASAIGSLSDRVGSMEKRLDRLEGRMGRFEGALNRMDNRLLLQQKSIADLTKCVKHLDTQTEENVRYISALMKGQSNMEYTVRNNHDEVCSRLDFFKDDFKKWKDITAQHSTEIMYLKKSTSKIAQ